MVVDDPRRDEVMVYANKFRDRIDPVIFEGVRETAQVGKWGVALLSLLSDLDDYDVEVPRVDAVELLRMARQYRLPPSEWQFLIGPAGGGRSTSSRDEADVGGSTLVDRCRARLARSRGDDARRRVPECSAHQAAQRDRSDLHLERAPQ